MKEQTLKRSVGVRFADADVAPSKVLVRSGPYSALLESGTVGHLRSRFGQRYPVAPQARPFLGGVAVGEDTVVLPNQLLRLSSRGAVKG